MSTTEIKFFIEESGWSKTTVPFNQEQVKVELAAFFIDGKAAFHDASPKPEPWMENIMKLTHLLSSNLTQA